MNAQSAHFELIEKNTNHTAAPSLFTIAVKSTNLNTYPFFVSVEQCAALLSVSQDYIHKQIRRGVFKVNSQCPKTIDLTAFFREAAIESESKNRADKASSLAAVAQS